jgi:hypothetical protein
MSPQIVTRFYTTFLTSRKQKAAKSSTGLEKKPNVVAETQKESSESEEEDEEDTMDLMSILKPSARGADKQSCSIPKVQKPTLKSKSSPAVIHPTSVQEINKISTGKVPSTLSDKNPHQTNKQQCKVPPSMPSAQEKRPYEKISIGRHSATGHNRNKKASTDGHSAMMDRHDSSVAAAARQDRKIPTGLVVSSSSSQKVSAPVYEAKERIVDVKISGVLLSCKVEIVLLTIFFVE